MGVQNLVTFPYERNSVKKVILFILSSSHANTTYIGYTFIEKTIIFILK